MGSLDDLDREIVDYWAAQHQLALGLPGRAFVEAATHAALGRLRCYHTAGDLLRWHDLSSTAILALIRSLLPTAPEYAVWQVWCSALHLRRTELDGTSPRLGAVELPLPDRSRRCDVDHTDR